MAYLVNISHHCLKLKYPFSGSYVFIDSTVWGYRENPGPKTKPNGNLSVCHWNVNIIPFYNFQKIAVLESFVAIHKFGVIYILEIFLNNTYEDNDLNLNGYSLLRADHPSNAKRGGVCIYYKETLALKVVFRISMKVFFVKLQLDQRSVLWELFTDLLAKILMNLSLFYQTLSFYFRIFSMATFI